MMIRMLAGAAFAALTVLVAPASAATLPAPYIPAVSFTGSVDQAVSSFYASRNGAPLWLRDGPDSTAARQLIDVLERASLDGMPSGPALAARARNLLSRARSGDASALGGADRLLSTAWVLYVQSIQRPPEGMTFADGWARPRTQSAQEVLMRAATAPSLASHVSSVSAINPVYAELRDAAWAQMQATGSVLDGRVRASLDRVRAMPFQKRYIIVDAGSARLWMVENGRIADSMKVIVGKPSTQTPMVASTIYYATLNPYWNVPPDLVRRLTAPRVLEQGLGYLKAHNYLVMTEYGDDGELLNPASIDWRAVAQGEQTVAVRQLPGPGNSMGRLKFGFPNSSDIYLHDTPQKDLFAQADRDISNGCIRVEDAQRLGRWLLGRDPITSSEEPEQHVLLPTPVPIYVTYLTAHGEGGQLTFNDDSYGRDRMLASQVATIGN